ncbi:MAG: DeoR/GlpR transcriptional regulator [Oscillospiraceae bacterium]|nr:DeoR/GlpR transcriptional regulator [Oscillospiraceae bacterium]
MFMEERQQKIAELIKENGKITVSEITERYGISDESARRDLRILEQKKLCKRTHGGAIALGQINVRPAADRDLEKMPVFDNYREIAKEAAKLIRSGDCIYLTGGSFGYIMLSFLPKDIRYTVVINNVDIAKALREFDNIEVYMVGGKMRQNGSIVDSLAAEFIGRMYFDICFITGGGFTPENGLSNGTDETASFQRTVIANSQKCVLLLSSHKIGVNSFIKVCDANIFDYIITDWDCSEEHLAAFESEGIYITVVEEPK